MEEHRPSPIDNLTVAGRLLLVGTLLLFGGGFYITIFYLADNFPPGQYPILVLLFPTCLVCFFIVLLTAWILRRCGIPIRKSNIPK